MFEIRPDSSLSFFTNSINSSKFLNSRAQRSLASSMLDFKYVLHISQFGWGPNRYPWMFNMKSMRGGGGGGGLKVAFQNFNVSTFFSFFSEKDNRGSHKSFWHLHSQRYQRNFQTGASLKKVYKILYILDKSKITSRIT